MNDHGRTEAETSAPIASRTLYAILLNPALREQRKTTTYRNVQAAADL